MLLQSHVPCALEQSIYTTGVYKFIQNNGHLCDLLLINVRENPVFHTLAVLVPTGAVLLLALFTVSSLSVDQQDQEINWVEVCQNLAKT